MSPCNYLKFILITLQL